ncbi:MAG: AsmA family protein [Bacteroidia bacterium]|nr:AsmA family protein [Bacteroidia bacterium]
MTDATPKKKKSLLGRILKWSGITLVLLLITAIALPFLFKDKIIALAKEEMNNNLNATVTFGEFDLSLISSFPDFRFSISDFTIVGKDKFEGDTLTKIPSLKLDLDLMSVISGEQYKINSIQLERPRIFALVLPDGSANWDITKPSTDTAAAAPTSSEPTKFKMTLSNLEINNAYIVYDDASLAVKTVLDDFTHTLKGDFTQDFFGMETMTTIERFTCEYEGMSYLNQVKTVAKADFDVDMINWKFTFKENEVSLNDLGFGFDGFFAMPGADYKMDLTFKAKQAEFKSFLSLIPGAYTEDFKDVKSAGTLAFDGYAKGTYSDASKLSPGFGLNFQVKDGMFQYPSVPKPVTAINIDCKIDNATGVTNDTKIDLNKFHMDFGGNPIDAALHVATPETDASLDGWVKGKLNLASLKEFMPLEKDDQLNGNIDADIKMKGRMSQIEKEQYDQFQCSGKLDIANMIYKGKTDTYETSISALSMLFSPKFVELAKFDGKLGKNDVHANGRVDNIMAWLFKDSLLSGNFVFNSSMMDLNEFAGEETEGAAPAAEDTSAMEIIPVPSNIDFVLKSSITKLIYDDINMDNVAGTITIRNSAVDMSDLKMNLMGGSMVLNGFYNTQNVMVPKVKFNMDIQNFDIQQTFKTFNTVQQLAPVAKYTTGRFSTTLNYTSDLGSDMMPITETMNGQGTLATQQVVIDGFPAMKKLDEALKMNKFSKVTMQDLKMVSFKIENGRVSTEPFDFTAGKAKGKMGGSTGVDQTINYVMDISIPRAEFGPANTALNGMVSSVQAKGIPFQLGDMVNVQALFGGTVTEPTVKTNLKEAGQDMMDNLKDQVVNTVTQKVDSMKKDVINKACVEAQNNLNKVKADAASKKQQAYKLADDAKTSAYAEADKVEKSFKNPWEKAAKKAAADAMRKKADDANKQAKATADKVEADAIGAAQKQVDSNCK